MPEPLKIVLLAKKIRPPSPQSIKRASLGFVHSSDAMHCQVRGPPLKSSQFPLPPHIGQGDGAPLAPDSSGRGPSMPAPVDTHQSSTVQ